MATIHVFSQPTRYPESYGIITQLDPMSDIIVLVDGLSSREYLTDTIKQNHSLSQPEAARRSKVILPHIRSAILYVRQSLDGPAEVSFVPAYYAILNLLKVYILLGPHHADWAKNRRHGARYLGYRKDSQNILTERIVLDKRGALPLFYETLTGESLGEKTVSMSDVYPFIVDISAEYWLAAGESSKLARVEFQGRNTPPGQSTLIANVTAYDNDRILSLRELKLLSGWKANSKERSQFTHNGPGRDADWQAYARGCVCPWLLYQDSTNKPSTPLSSKHMLLPEEFPIALAFFHLSSVARYKPEFLEKLRDSRYWPMVAAARRHCLHKMLVLFWSFMHQRSLAFG